MTKTEKAEMEHLRSELASARALHLPDYAKPERLTRDELTPTEGQYSGGVVTAWYQWNAETSYQVSEGCSDGVGHNPSGTDRTNSQSVGEFYRTKMEALRVVRHEMTERFAKALAAVDAEIEKEMK